MTPQFTSKPASTPRTVPHANASDITSDNWFPDTGQNFVRNGDRAQELNGASYHETNNLQNTLVMDTIYALS